LLKFLRKIWAIYGFFIFLALMAVSFPVFFLNMALTPGQRALRRNIWYLHHVFTPAFLTFVGIRLKVSGREKLDPGMAYVIVGNHRSSLDFVANAGAFPGVFRYLAKVELLKMPVFGWVVKKMCLTVDRSSAMSRARSVVEIKQQIQAGWSIFIYPEGSRNKSLEPLGPFYDGAFRIAIQAGAPIVIQTIINPLDFTSLTDALDLKPGILRIVWDGPIHTTGMSTDDIPALHDQVRSIMLERLQSYQSGNTHAY
jgi:1-acyl-sn-glycerol-3-phosphate acyltransferase